MKRPVILVVGGAGYIGSHMVWRLGQAGCTALVLDNLSQGRAAAVPAGQLLRGELADGAALDLLLQACRPDAVMHFASFIQVEQSLREPATYYRNNVANSLTLCEAMLRNGVDKLVFSSSAAVYGQPQTSPIAEDHPKAPINPYGRSKWMVEQMLADLDRAHGLRSICLRYFNAAGAQPDQGLGECHQPETHLIPLVLQAAAGRRPAITIHGRDYPGGDGSCVRDYIHVRDLCEAHWLALGRLLDGGASAAYNLGNGHGYSIVEVIETAERVCGRSVARLDGPRRPGDPAVLVADASLARRELGWTPRAGLDTIIADAWQWELQRPGPE